MGKIVEMGKGGTIERIKAWDGVRGEIATVVGKGWTTWDWGGVETIKTWTIGMGKGGKIANGRRREIENWRRKTIKDGEIRIWASGKTLKIGRGKDGAIVTLRRRKVKDWVGATIKTWKGIRITSGKILKIGGIKRSTSAGRGIRKMQIGRGNVGATLDAMAIKRGIVVSTRDWKNGKRRKDSLATLGKIGLKKKNGKGKIASKNSKGGRTAVGKVAKGIKEKT